MKNQCSCGNILAFSESEIGQKVRCQQCHLELELKPDQKAMFAFSWKKWLWIYAGIFCGVAFLTYIIEGDYKAKAAISIVRASHNSYKGRLDSRADIMYRQFREKSPYCKSHWKAFEGVLAGEWFVHFEIYEPAPSYRILGRAIFRAILAETPFVEPQNELATELCVPFAPNIATLKELADKQADTLLKEKLLKQLRDIQNETIRIPKIPEKNVLRKR